AYDFYTYRFVLLLGCFCLLLLFWNSLAGTGRSFTAALSSNIFSGTQVIAIIALLACMIADRALRSQPSAVGAEPVAANLKGKPVWRAMGAMPCGSSFLFVLLGFPCATFNWDVCFRVNSLMNTILGLSIPLLAPGNKTHSLLRVFLLLNSFGMFTVSLHWCSDFDSWAIGTAISTVYQTLSGIVLVKTHVPKHVVFHVVGVVACYMFRAESSNSLVDGRQWAAIMVSVAVLCVSVMWLVARDVAGEVALKTLEDQVPALRIPLDSALSSGTSTRKSSGSRTPGSPLLSKFDLPDNAPENLELLHYVSEGSFGRVYCCNWGGQRVAAKVMALQTGHRADPIREANLCQKLSHDNLVQTFDFFQHSADPADPGCGMQVWILQEWCDKGTLGSFCTIPRWDASGLRYVRCIMTDVAKACCYLHSNGIIHGDLTSNNVLLQTQDQAGEIEFVCKLCDFGLARVLEQGVTSLMTAQLGTVSHMPPELLEYEDGRLTMKADVYAMGVLLYQAVLGKGAASNYHQSYLRRLYTWYTQDRVLAEGPRTQEAPEATSRSATGPEDDGPFSTGSRISRRRIQGRGLPMLTVLQMLLLLSQLIALHAILISAWAVCPSTSAAQASMLQNFTLLCFYVFYVVYLMLSALQLSYDVHIVRGGLGLTHSVDMVPWLLFKVYTTVPFLEELRVLTDWTVTETSMNLFMWFKLEDAQQNLYKVRCDMNARKYVKPEAKRPIHEKVLQGGLFLLALFVLIVGPVTYFSTANLFLKSNLVYAGSLKASLE
ncbi:gdt2, partial [Symbiodinium sp. CCMP2456]